MSPPHNPYSPPSAPRGYRVAPAPYLPSRAPRILGILSIVFGALAAMGCGLLALGALVSYFEHDRSGWKPASEQAMDGTLGLNLATIAALGVVLLIIGIGQTGYRRWAVFATRLWAVLALMDLVGGIVLGALTLILSTALGWGVISTLVFAPYPILLLVLFARERITVVMNR